MIHLLLDSHYSLGHYLHDRVRLIFTNERVGPFISILFMTVSSSGEGEIELHCAPPVARGGLEVVDLIITCTKSRETVTDSTVQYSTVWYTTVQNSTVRYGTERYGTVRYGTVQYSTVQYSTSRYSTVRYCTVQYSTQ